MHKSNAIAIIGPSKTGVMDKCIGLNHTYSKSPICRSSKDYDQVIIFADNIFHSLKMANNKTKKAATVTGVFSWTGFEIAFR